MSVKVLIKADVDLNILSKLICLFFVMLITHATILAQETNAHKIKIASYYNQIDSLEQAKADFDQILKIKRQLTWTLVTYEQEQDYTEQIKLVNELKSLIPQVNRYKYEAEILTIAGILDFKRGNHENALKNHFKALAIKEEHNSSGQAFNHHQIGAILSSRLNYQEALNKFRDARSIYLQEGKDPPKLLQRIGRAFLKMGQLDSSQHYLEKSILRAEELNNMLIKGTSISNLAEVSLDRGAYEESIVYLDQSVELRKNKMTIAHEITLHKLYARNYLQLRNLTLAREYINKSLHLANDLSSYGALSQAYEIKVLIDKEQGYQDSLLMDYELWIRSLDSFYLIENNQNFNTVYQELGVAQKENTIKQKNQELSMVNRRIRNIIGVATIMLLALTMLGYLYRKKVSYERTIIAQNDTIKKALAEKEVLLKEIHHRVKNNLQVISSLLGLQGLSVKDAKAKAAIQEGRSRVHSMSLIHLSLYKKDNLTGIEMKPYLEKLATDLIATYNYQDINIQSVINSEDITLDVETVVPVGLIINELVTNSVKYAFEGRRSGTITIELMEHDDKLRLSVSDDGIGLEDNDLQAKKDSFGHQLIRTFRQKLDADIEIHGIDGTSILFLIGDYNVIRNS